MKTNSHHIPVLLEAVLDILKPQAGESYLDLTAGYGGHAQAVIDLTKSPGLAVLVDRDAMAISALKERFGASEPQPEVLHSSFSEACKQLRSDDRQFDLILMDLGVSSPQLETSERGFSFQLDAELDMRMDQRTELTASHIINSYSEKDLVTLIKAYGEEPHAKTIAKAICANRPIRTTTQLAKVIEAKIYRSGKTHPATRTFQSLRIAVNDEIGELERTLPQLIDLLTPSGRVAFITFHSLEDRLVKNFLKEEANAGYEARLELLNKKPVLGQNSDLINPRARSAKLRGAVKK